MTSDSMKLFARLAPYMLLATLVFVAACSNQRDIAERSLNSAENAVTAAAADAHKYLPDQLALLERRLSDLNGSFELRDYAAVRRDAPPVVADAKRLAHDAAERKQQAAKALDAHWSDIASSLPDLLDRIELRIDALNKTSHVPKGVELAAARSAVNEANAIWQKAQIAFATGQMDEAVSEADQGSTKAEAAATAIDLNPRAVASATR
jgi:hypothetical protein